MSVSHSVGGRLIHIISLIRITDTISTGSCKFWPKETIKQWIKTNYDCNMNCSFLQLLFPFSLHAFGKLKCKNNRKTFCKSEIKLQYKQNKKVIMVPTTNLNPKESHLFLVIIAAIIPSNSVCSIVLSPPEMIT